MASKHRVLSYVAGLLYFYGALRLETVCRLLEERLNLDELDREAIQALLDDNVRDERSPYVFECEGDCYYDIEVTNWQRLLREQDAQAELTYRPVHEAEAADLVRDCYKSLWQNGERRFFEWLMSRCGGDGELALPLMLEYTAEIKNGTASLEVAQKLVRQLELTAVEDVQEAAERVKELADETPQWVLKGWRRTEL